MRKIVSIFSLILILSILCAGCQNENLSKVGKESSPIATIQAMNSGNESGSQVDESDTRENLIEDYYKVIKIDDNSYTIILYDKNKIIIHQETVTKEPYISLVDENIIRVTISLGNPLNYIYFYDILSSKISPVYENALLFEKDKIVFMKDNVLIVSNIFSKDLYYKEIKRNFSQTAVPSSAIVSVKFTEPTKLQLNYLEGKDFEEKSEIIDLNALWYQMIKNDILVTHQ